jgi:hypothetical protein
MSTPSAHIPMHELVTCQRSPPRQRSPCGYFHRISRESDRRLGAGPLWIQILAVGVQIHRFWALAAMPLRAAKDAPLLAACAEVHAPVDVWVDLGADYCVWLAPDCHTCPTAPRTPPPAAWRPLRLYSILCTVSTWFRVAPALRHELEGARLPGFAAHRRYQASARLVLPLVRDARSGAGLVFCHCTG